MFQQKRQRREMEDTEREQLLTRRFQANADTTIDLDYSLQHHTQMNNAHKGVDEMLSTGSNILDSLKNQRELLKGARNKMVSIGSTLGLSDHTMRLIERRVKEDKWVMLAGMFVTLFIIALVIYFLL
jgi:golgi SNAP receptor complex member 2